MSEDREMWLKCLAFTIGSSGALPVAIQRHELGGCIMCAVLLAAGVLGLWRLRP